MSNPEVPSDDHARGSFDISEVVDQAFSESLLVSERNILHTELCGKISEIRPQLNNGLGFFKLSGGESIQSLFFASDRTPTGFRTTIIHNQEAHAEPNTDHDNEAVEINALSCFVITENATEHYGAYEILQRRVGESWKLPRSAVLIEQRNGIVHFLGPKRPDLIAPAKIHDSSIADIHLQIRAFDYTWSILKLCSRSLQTDFSLETPWVRP